MSTELLRVPRLPQGRAAEKQTVRRRGWVVRRALVAADLAGLLVAFTLTQLVFGSGSGAEDTFGLHAEAILFAATLPVWLLLAKLYRLYDRDEERTDHSTSDDVIGVFHLVTVCTWLLAAIAAVSFTNADFTRLLLFWAAAIAFIVLARALARGLARRAAAYRQRAVIVGTDDVAQLLARKLLRHDEYSVDVLGFVGSSADERRDSVAHLPLVGTAAELPELVDRLDVDRVIIAFPDDETDLVALARSLRQRDVQVDIVPRLHEVVGPTVDTHTIEGTQLIGLPPAKLRRSDRALKRTLDVAIASLALLVTAPFFAIVAWRIKRDSPGPVFFRQTRLGMGMQPFQLLKFRTMRADTTEEEHRSYVGRAMDPWGDPEATGLYKLDRDDAVTPVGRWLRRTSLDELPQLLNVLRGEMSLVGPRPCIPYETELFASHHFERFLVPAGMTGLWQVKARAHSTFREALDLDVTYAHGWSFGLDVRLLLQTPLQLFRPRHTT